jgi:hypothetical protein
MSLQENNNEGNDMNTYRVYYFTQSAGLGIVKIMSHTEAAAESCVLSAHGDQATIVFSEVC